MIDFTVFVPSTGQILWSGQCNDGDLGSQGGGGNAVMEGAHAYGTGWIEYVGIDEVPTFFAFPARPSEFHEWNYTTKAWEVSSAQIAAARAKKLFDLDLAYASSRNVPFSFGGSSLSCSDLAIDGIRCVVSQIENIGLMPDEWNGWRTVDGSRLTPLNALDSELARAKSILVSAESRRAALLSIFWNHADAIAALTTVSAIMAYDVTTGWPG